MIPVSEHNKNVIAVIPAFNEELAIGSVVLRTAPFVNHVIVVDDGSQDMTSTIAEHAGAEVIRLSKNQGKAHAVMRGFDRARQLGADIVVMLDGDGQHHPEEIPSVIAPLITDDADFVIGSRFLRGGNGIPSYRKLGQKTLNTFTKFASSYNATDSQSGFRALNSSALNSFTIEPLGYNLESVMISYLSDKGFRIVEVPIHVNYMIPNPHKTNFLSHGMAVISNLVGIIGYRRPLISFGIPGLIMIAIGLHFALWALSEYSPGAPFPYALTAVGGVFLLIGLLLINTALILNSIVQLMVKYQK
jgi:glycosyltransferase involved in cell wall biosynthesis